MSFSRTNTEKSIIPVTNEERTTQKNNRVPSGRALRILALQQSSMEQTRQEWPRVMSRSPIFYRRSINRDVVSPKRNGNKRGITRDRPPLLLLGVIIADTAHIHLVHNTHGDLVARLLTVSKVNGFSQLIIFPRTHIFHPPLDTQYRRAIIIRYAYASKRQRQ